jgi:hypothetical protein
MQLSHAITGETSLSHSGFAVQVTIALIVIVLFLCRSGSLSALEASMI